MPQKKPGQKLPEGVFHATLPRGAFGVYVPEGYEPNYAYPLLVLLHNRGANEHQMMRLAPRLSRRNYIAVSLRGTDRIGIRRTGRAAYSWSQFAEGELRADGPWRIHRHLACASRTAQFLDEYVAEVVALLSEELNIDRHRIYLIGYGEGAAAAYRIGLGAPARYAGIAALNGWLPAVPGPWLRWPEARRLRALVLHGAEDDRVPVAESLRAARLLYTAGLNVSYYVTPGSHRINRHMLQLLNRWLIAGCRHPS